VTLPGPWRVLTSVAGWSEKRYTRDITRLLERSLIVPKASGGARLDIT
jgi:hypothetical protein